MLNALLRKGRQLAADPVLRRWLGLRVLGRTPAEPGFTPHHPPYLGAEWSGLPPERPATALAASPFDTPTTPLVMRLAGKTVTVMPGEEQALMDRAFADIETRLSFHRFAWVPLRAAETDHRWVGAIWRAWVSAFGCPDGSHAWHPYTAAERAINLLDFARVHGLPDGAAPVLAAHGPVIAAKLEWFGDHHTSNHCANNGRGLYLLGLALGMERATQAGARILTEEAKRLFHPSGVLREASTHYHLLLTRQWASVWLAALAHGRPEAPAFEVTLRRAMAVLPHFNLPGGLPLIGDVSPDCPPGHLLGLIPGGDALTGWTGLLTPDQREALLALRDAVTPVDTAALAGDGWLRRDIGPWSALFHAEPGGWSPMPGHGHQDCGAPEIHFGGEAIFVDPGRGSYELAGEADPYVAGASHGGLLVDGADPYPQNRPYYAPSFRHRAAGTAEIGITATGAAVTHGGLRRLGIDRVERVWSFAPEYLLIDDCVAASRGRHCVIRRLVTPLEVSLIADAAILRSPASGRRFRVSAETGRLDIEPITLWSAYGEGRAGTALVFRHIGRLPWQGRLTIEVLD